MTLSFPQELIGLFDHLRHIFLRNKSLHSIVSLNSLVERIKKPAVELLIQQASFNKLISERCMHTTVLSKAQILLIQ